MLLYANQRKYQRRGSEVYAETLDQISNIIEKHLDADILGGDFNVDIINPTTFRSKTS